MDNSPNNNNNSKNTPSGDIFSGNESSYSAATSLPENETNPYPNPTSEVAPAAPPESPPQNPESVGPPPYTPDNRKKFLLIGIIITFFILIAVLIMKLLSSKPGSGQPQNITLTYWGLWEDKSIMQPILDDYKRSHPAITINYVKRDPQLYRETLQSAIDKGNGPDIYRFHNTWVPMLIKSLSPVPASIYSPSDFAKTFYPVTTDDLKVGNNIYGIPLEIDGLVLFYNEDMLKASNVPVPSTWEDVKKAVDPASNKLTVKQGTKIITSGIALGTAENIEHFSDILGLMFLQNGASPVKSLVSCPAIKDCTNQVLTFYRQFSEPPNNTWDDTLDNSITAFAGGKVAMIIAPSWEVFTIKTLNKSLNFKIAQVPQLPCVSQPCAPINWATYWVEGVNAKSQNQSAAWEFLRYLSDPQTMKKLYGLEQQSRTLFGEPYSRVDLGSSLNSNQYIGPLINEAPTMKSFYSASKTYDGDSGINSSINKYLKDAVNFLGKGGSIEEALSTADKGFKQVFSRFGISSAQ